MSLGFVLNLSVLLSFAFSIQLQHDFHFTMLNERVESNRSIVLCKMHVYMYMQETHVPIVHTMYKLLSWTEFHTDEYPHF